MAPRRSRRWRVLCALALAASSLAANCGEQIAATLDQDSADAGAYANMQFDGALGPDRGPADRLGDVTGLPLDAGPGLDIDSVDGAGQDATAPADASMGSNSGDAAYHPIGWDQAEQHGLASNRQAQDCRLCHGQDLTGLGPWTGCDSCHDTVDPGWRSNCVFCHGGLDNGSGAPPEDLADRSDPSLSGVGAHSEHVGGADHLAYDCAECHLKPIDALSPGHLFDSSPGVAEVVFDSAAGTLSPAASYSSGACSALYCHGDGLLVGASPLFSDGADLSCDACHPGPAALDWASMSGRHASHLGRGALCAECHAAVVDATAAIVAAPLHVNGSAEVEVPTGSYDAASGDCSTSCHSTAVLRNWLTGGQHPADWALEQNHGTATFFQTEDCRSCHGDDLRGGTSGISCDSCHDTVDPGWRSNCVFCHGGLDNTTGAPPYDLRKNSVYIELTVGAHSEHVSGTHHPAYDCTECHLKPVDVLSPGHLFDSSPGVAEVVFDSAAGTLSPLASYSNGACSALYCHGNRQRDNGNVSSFTTTISACDACHPFLSSAADAWQNLMSGQHKKHLEYGTAGSPSQIHCWECHGGVLDNSDGVSVADLHVNGQADVQLVSGTAIPGTPTECSNVVCHGKDHGSRRVW